MLLCGKPHSFHCWSVASSRCHPVVPLEGLLDILHGVSHCSASTAGLLWLLSACMRRRMSCLQEPRPQLSRCSCSMSSARGDAVLALNALTCCS